MLGWVGQYGPLDPRKLQLWLVRSCQGVVEVELRGSPKHLIGWAASMAVCVCGGITSVVTTEDDPLPHGLPGMDTRKPVQYC